MYNEHLTFEFDADKETQNVRKHGLGFDVAKQVFLDPEALYLADERHSLKELRRYAVGRVSDGRIITVWFTWRGDRIRIIGAADLRKWRKEYEKRKTSGS